MATNQNEANVLPAAGANTVASTASGAASVQGAALQGVAAPSAASLVGGALQQGGVPPNSNPLGGVAQLTSQQMTQLCIEKLNNDYKAYQHGGGKDTFKQWLQPQVEEVVKKDSAQGNKNPPPKTDPPTDGAAISWFVFPALEAAGFVVGGPIGFVVATLADSIIDGIINGGPNTGDPNMGAGDGSQGTSPGNAGGLPGGDGGTGSGDGDGGSDPVGGSSSDGTGSGDGGDPIGGDGGNSTFPNNPDPTTGGGDPGGGDGCFVAGTPVRTGNDGWMAIEGIALESTLASCDMSTGVVSNGSVARLFRATSAEIVAITFVGETLRCTPRHRFFTDSGWMAAGRLSPGTRVRCLEGAMREILDVSVEQAEIPVFNMQVDRQHTYFVGKEGYLVHNEKDTGLDGGEVDPPPDGSDGLDREKKTPSVTPPTTKPQT
jgi:hypothetical protein